VTYEIRSGTDWLRSIDPTPPRRRRSRFAVTLGTAQPSLEADLWGMAQRLEDPPHLRVRMGGPSDLPGLPLRPGDVPLLVEPSTRMLVTLTDRCAAELREAASIARDGDEWGGWLYGSRVRSWSRS